MNLQSTPHALIVLVGSKEGLKVTCKSRQRNIICYYVAYALPSFAGQLSRTKSDKSRINALFRKALKLGLCNTSLDTEELITTALLKAT